MLELSFCDGILVLAVAWLAVAQRRFHRVMRAEVTAARETAEDLGWNWERDDAYSALRDPD